MRFGLHFGALGQLFVVKTKSNKLRGSLVPQVDYSKTVTENRQSDQIKIK